MPELDAVVEVEAGTPAPLAGIVGDTITEVLRLRYRRFDMEAGFVVVTSQRGVAIVDCGDEMSVGAWPDDSLWSDLDMDVVPTSKPQDTTAR
jgi:hypothetical protein